MKICLRFLGYLLAAAFVVAANPPAVMEAQITPGRFVNVTFSGQTRGPVGTCAAPAYAFTGAETTGMSASLTGPAIYWCVAGLTVLGQSSNHLRLGASTVLSWTDTSAATGNPDAIVAREGPNHIFQRNVANAQRFSIANTYTSSTNYEAFSVDWQTASNTVWVGSRTAATGSSRQMFLVVQTNSGANFYTALNMQNGAPFFRSGLTTTTGIWAQSSGFTGNFSQFGEFTSTASSGTLAAVAITPTYNQTGTAGGVDLLIQRTATAVGSGTHLLIQAGTAASPNMFTVDTTGAPTFANNISSTGALLLTSSGTSGEVRSTQAAGAILRMALGDGILGITDQTRTDFTAVQYGPEGSVTSGVMRYKKVTGIADNTATDVFTVTVPNANHSCSVKVRFTSANGSTDAFESTRVAEGMVAVARTTGVNAVAAVAALEMAQIATVAAGATHTLAYSLGAVSGAVGATNTFTIRVTIDDSGNVGSNQVLAEAVIMNGEATGCTIA